MARIDQVLAGEKSWGKYALDVLGHTGLGAAYSVLPIAAMVFLLDAGFGLAMAVGQPCALAGGAAREVLQFQKSGKLHLADRLLDVAHHALGPPVAWGIVLLIRLAIG